MAKVVWDESQNGLNLAIGGGTWSKVSIERFFDGAAIWPAFAANDSGDTGQYGTLSITFQGTQISLFGNTPIAQASQNIFVSIDGGTPYNTSYGDPSPPTALQWYQSPVLADGTHTLNITHIAGTSLDYAVMVAGPSTPLMGAGQVLIVDDGDSDIIYEGTWTRNVGRYTSSDNPHLGLPYGNATHQSGTKGSKATFAFSGSAVSVYSVFDWSALGSVTVTYTLDNTPQTITHAVTPQTEQYLEGVLQRENTLLFASNSSLTAGNHTLTIEVQGNTNGSALVLDYLLYTPAFQTLAAKPNLVPTVSGSPTTSSIPAGTGISGGSGPTTAPGERSSTPVGAVAGGVVGGAAVLAILLIFVLYRKRSARREKNTPHPEASGRLLPFRQYYDDERQPSAGLIFEPFTAMAPTNATTPVANFEDGQYHKPSMPFFPVVTAHTNTSSSTRSSVPEISRSEMTQKSATGPSTRAFTAAPIPEPASAPMMPLPAPLQPELVVSGGGGMLRSRMQRLQALVTELNREIGMYGESGVRVAELRGRIAELTREEEAGVGSVSGDVRDTREGAVPPPYDARRIDA
ncbi:hypothetical protein H0H81_001713 [Sphagnurus paluster]|uniref:Transmembrane protein n=1 Tax=Sphagnurus paluster TaxID=117069 RepID=A0A9P7GIE5_9AGAR|nr:hypothetical protein H0H81_001713 [Sphagnurus paluster]